MPLETILIWIVVGLVAGFLAGRVLRTGFGLFGNIGVGIVGAVLGGFIFRALRIHLPVPGILGAIIVAFVGALVLILLLRLLARAK